jgi:hypothetical protein
LSDTDEMRAAVLGVPVGAGSARGVSRVLISVSGYFISLAHMVHPKGKE